MRLEGSLRTWDISQPSATIGLNPVGSGGDDPGILTTYDAKSTPATKLATGGAAEPSRGGGVGRMHTATPHTNRLDPATANGKADESGRGKNANASVHGLYESTGHDLVSRFQQNMHQPEVRLWPKSTTNFDLLRLLSAVTCRPWPQFYQKVDLNTAFCVSDYRVHDSPIVYVSSSFETLTGYSEEDCLGFNCRFLQGAETNPMTVRSIRRCIERGNEGRFKLKNYCKDGKPFMNYLSIIPIFTGPLHDLIYYLGVQSNVPWENEDMLSSPDDSGSERISEGQQSLGDSTCTGFTGAVSGVYIRNQTASESSKRKRRRVSDVAHSESQRSGKGKSVTSGGDKDVEPRLGAAKAPVRTQHKSAARAPIELVGKNEEKIPLAGALGGLQGGALQGQGSGGHLRATSEKSLDTIAKGTKRIGDIDDSGSNYKRGKAFRYESHSVIEKRRRDRINLCLTQLAELVPECREVARRSRKKLDKAEVLERAVEHVKEMDKKILAAMSMRNITDERYAAPKVGKSAVMAWDLEKVCEWLKTMLLGQYVSKFVECAVDGPLLLSLTNDELKEDLEIENRLHRKKIMIGLERLKNGTDTYPSNIGISGREGPNMAHGAQGLLKLAASSVAQSPVVLISHNHTECVSNSSRASDRDSMLDDVSIKSTKSFADKNTDEAGSAKAVALDDAAPEAGPSSSKAD